ncbi:energy transducer TonB [Aquimarina addita]|uniref:Energy transducer TonB n=1 Tax=Aquimarina addita TaxID=870485 RepID=A0ABP6UIJ7_9FLAO
MSNKHDANARKGTLVNFQIGLIASLLFTYLMFEVYTAEPMIKDAIVDHEVYEDVNFTMDTFIVESKPPEEIAAKITQPKVPEFIEPEVVEDDKVLEKLEEEFKSEPIPESSTPFDPSALNNLPDEIIDVPVEVPFSVVEFVPIFPGCEKLGTNKERAACFSEKITKIVSRKFNSGLGSEYGLTGIQRIYTMFDVATDGTIQNIKVRAAHRGLEKEAIRVINLFPTMTPGKQRDTPVTVKYQLPIVFQIQD